MVQISLVSYIFAYGCSQFFYGPLSDIYGRRIIILIGLLIFNVATILAIISTNIYLFIIARILQGIGMGCGDTMGRAIMCDVFKGQRFVKAASYISMASTLTPLGAPILGGYFAYLLSWHACFIFLLIYGILNFILVWRYLPETKNNELPALKSIKGIINTYRFIIRNQIFLGFFIPGLISFFGEILYNMVSPFLLQDRLGLSPVAFGWLAIFTISGLLLGSILAKAYAHKITHYHMVLIGLYILLLGSISMLVPSLFGYLSITTIVLPMVIFMLGIGITYPNTNMGALAPFTNMAGTAGALQGGLQMITSGLLGLVLADMRNQTQFPLAFTLTIFSGLGLLSFFILLKPRKSSICSAHKDDESVIPY
jgi:DHA1 family 2-module integral membrane pump EmrD-like MFS transporter